MRLPVNAVLVDRFGDHLADGQSLAAIARGVARKKPREAALRIVRSLLLREDKDEAKAISEMRPARAVVIGVGCLGAAVQCDDEGRRWVDAVRHVDVHAQIPGVAPKVRNLMQPTGSRGRFSGPFSRRSFEPLLEEVAQRPQAGKRDADAWHETSLFALQQYMLQCNMDRDVRKSR